MALKPFSHTNYRPEILPASEIFNFNQPDCKYTIYMLVPCENSLGTLIIHLIYIKWVVSCFLAALTRHHPQLNQTHCQWWECTWRWLCDANDHLKQDWMLARECLHMLLIWKGLHGSGSVGLGIFLLKEMLLVYCCKNGTSKDWSASSRYCHLVRFPPRTLDQTWCSHEQDCSNTCQHPACE